MGKRRVFIIVIDGFGIGSLPDADLFGDRGSDTLASIAGAKTLHIPHLISLGLGNIEGVRSNPGVPSPTGAFARMAERSMGKDTVTGHWEIAGVITEKAFPTYPEGFPADIISAFEERTGRKTMVNRPMSGTEIIKLFGERHMRSGDLIVYTSADSVFQIAAHEDIVPLDELYRYCEIARDLLQGEHGVGRVIARPFAGSAGHFVRTPNRHDYALEPPRDTMLDRLTQSGKMTVGVGKIRDIFAGRGISRSFVTRGNRDGMEATIRLAKEGLGDLIFVNLVDFDTLYGHRNDIEGYAAALSDFDAQLVELCGAMGREDILMVTADHGCDPGYAGTDHTREYVPLLVWGAQIKNGVDLKTRDTFADIAATVLEGFGIDYDSPGNSFFSDMIADTFIIK